MRITHFLYNAFLIEEEGIKVAIDPGQNLWIFKLESLIPRSEWPTITHVVITHGDPDHHSREALLRSLKITLAEALDFNREEAQAAAAPDFTEETLTL